MKRKHLSLHIGPSEEKDRAPISFHLGIPLFGGKKQHPFKRDLLLILVLFAAGMSFAVLAAFIAN